MQCCVWSLSGQMTLGYLLVQGVSAGYLLLSKSALAAYYREDPCLLEKQYRWLGCPGQPSQGVIHVLNAVTHTFH